MALIEQGHPAASGSTIEYWHSLLQNTRILLFELDKAILILERQEKEQYSFDTGQTTITVRRVNLPTLIKERAALLRQIQEIEALLENLRNPGGSFTQIIPW